MEKKGCRYLDAMQPATRISVPLEINQKGSTEFREGKMLPKRKKIAERKEATAKWGIIT